MDDIEAGDTRISKVFDRGEEFTFDTVCIDGEIRLFHMAFYRPRALVARQNEWISPQTVVVRDVEDGGEGFDARHSAVRRTYRYTVLNRPVPDPFLAPVSWHVEAPLDLDLLRLGCDPLVGEHDFSAFCRRPKRRDGEEASLVRHVTRAGWSDLGEGVLRFEIEANAFCHQMIRSVVGTLVDVGLARKHAGELLGILRGRSRAAASSLAPPQGLCLWSVAYA